MTKPKGFKGPTFIVWDRLSMRLLVLGTMRMMQRIVRAVVLPSIPALPSMSCP
ncbi:hypothetical protein Mnod_5698 [Methylobacterium nodulans ORS 2060]|uniref:Uncharacterized protein n=1 Tax=Methylobacterium nodulans (strain LMG 21967 / CNCM I-2342 / ORS 2060) TaxID=460265 RepID=B8IQM1_METNO|nr:hypothetical protein Mnod_5698 [Methylobacterium nodulans ORS 2060]